MHPEKVFKDFEIKKFGKYHDLNLKRDTLRLSRAFKNIREMCLKIYHLDPKKFLWTPGLAWQATLKKEWSKVRIINWHWYDINGWKKN